MASNTFGVNKKWAERWRLLNQLGNLETTSIISFEKLVAGFGVVTHKTLCLGIDLQHRPQLNPLAAQSRACKSSEVVVHRPTSRAVPLVE